MNYTSIQIRQKTRQRLAKLRIFRRETYDEVLNKLIDAAALGDEEVEYTAEFIEGLMQARRDVRAGNLITHNEMKRRLGL